ncbi:AP-3 complex subunit beta, putative [Entamoeba invadens IP1]|uniref:AP-3 complex subunit beta, putative n=1 Tax=Entamoeba invadens IP1 TaxID=370355 RepID=A0A0A1TWZ6_ENTIV|nr:AP-3 complex subunit beta, putative [Entamoeba invadens IP1]ELP85778.1 AP-3 complex subunit beta, putative [Entamoeba invadens IP1]|eukprot:XP_004185124.1 AP-3 complex subunit beta, putative [Entamoeba invadens IP1]
MNNNIVYTATSAGSMPSMGSEPETPQQNTTESSGIMHNNLAAIDPLRKMLFNPSDKDKLAALKAILKLETEGLDTSELFAEIAMNVGSQEMELRKLVCMYIVSHSEKDPTNALMAVNTMHKALSSPHTFVRTLALQSITSLRVKDIAQLMVIAVSKAVKDTSPYIRKAAALAIPKIYNLDERRFDECVNLIVQMLEDKNPIVLGSTCLAFLKVCPTRYDLIHKHYTKLCQALVDCEEWGQVPMMSLLEHYARTQFTDPNLTVLDDDNELDKDLMFLISSVSPLFYSMNPAVVVEATLLYFHVGHHQDRTRAVRGIMKLTSSSFITQEFLFPILLSLVAQQPSAFVDYLDDFFLFPDDPVEICEMKLEIVTLLVQETNCQKILDELKDYTTWNNPRIVTISIQAMSRLSMIMPETSERCMVQLLQFMSSKSPEIVAEAVIGIKKLLQQSKNGQNDPERDLRIIGKMSKLLIDMKIAQARASIVWVIGEYSQMVPKLGPDILRILAKTFVDEEECVKQQVLTFAAKLYVTNKAQSEKLVRYIFQLAMYDNSFDIRDRERMLRRFLFDTTGECKELQKQAKEVLLSEKPTPVVGGFNKERQGLLEGTLSHYLNTVVSGYEDLEEFSLQASDPSLRKTAIVVAEPVKKEKAKKEKKEVEDDLEGWLNGDEEEDGKKKKHGGMWGSGDESTSEEEEESEGSASEEDGHKVENVEKKEELKEQNQDDMDWDAALGLVQDNLKKEDEDEKEKEKEVDHQDEQKEEVGDDAFEAEGGFEVGGDDDWGLLDESAKDEEKPVEVKEEAPVEATKVEQKEEKQVEETKEPKKEEKKPEEVKPLDQHDTDMSAFMGGDEEKEKSEEKDAQESGFAFI